MHRQGECVSRFVKTGGDPRGCDAAPIDGAGWRASCIIKLREIYHSCTNIYCWRRAALLLAACSRDGAVATAPGPSPAPLAQTTPTARPLQSAGAIGPPDPICIHQAQSGASKQPLYAHPAKWFYAGKWSTGICRVCDYDGFGRPASYGAAAAAIKCVRTTRQICSRRLPGTNLPIPSLLPSLPT